MRQQAEDCVIKEERTSPYVLARERTRLALVAKRVICQTSCYSPIAGGTDFAKTSMSIMFCRQANDESLSR